MVNEIFQVIYQKVARYFKGLLFCLSQLLVITFKTDIGILKIIVLITKRYISEGRIYSHHSKMVMTNFTGDGNEKTVQELFCSAELTAELHNQLICLSVLNIFLSITAFLGNALILAALNKENSLQPPSKLLFRNLAATDLCVGVVLEPLGVTYWISVIKKRWDICRYALSASFITSFILCSVSLLTMTAISVDRLLALLSGLRYRQHVVLKRRFVITVTVFWIVSIVGSTLYFWDYQITLWYSYIGLAVCLVISVFSYSKIFHTLRHLQPQVHIHQEQPSQTRPLNIARYKKAVYSALWLQLTLITCFLPYGIMAGFWNKSLSLFSARYFAVTLVYLNSSLNPFLFCWKIREVRRAVKETITQFLCSLS